MTFDHSGDPSTVLVVDDEDSIVDLVSSALRFTGYHVVSAQAGFDALRSVKSEQPDLIVLDVNLPDLDGFEVCRRLRRDGIDTPVIFLTARDEPEALRLGFRHGGDDYLTKPFSLEELTLRIEAVLRRSSGRPSEPTRLNVDTVVLDERAHRVTVDDKEVDLSPTEFRLLRYLMLNAGRALSKTQILEYVWEYDFDGDAGIVETYISYLRRKLGAAATLIRTVRGVGYALRESR
jgi:two-component system OmpR family response regulator